MAEEKEVKKPVVEISIGFIVCILILIISTLLIIRLNGDKKKLETDYAQLQSSYESLNERHEVLRQAALSIKSNPTKYSIDDLVKMLDEALGENVVETPSESGDVVAPSGETIQ
ncbi:MAG: hypothetical protein IKI57_06150 [Clostridia bacterium]|nr:hypothetical protein [Clostridia bacterium]